MLIFVFNDSILIEESNKRNLQNIFAIDKSFFLIYLNEKEKDVNLILD